MKIKKKLFSILFAFILTVSAVASAVFSLSPKLSASAKSYYDEENKTWKIDTNYWFQSIDVNIKVHEDKTMRITETMKVGFLKSGVNTGIIRDIQRISRTTRIINGEEEVGEQYLTQLTDVEVTIDGGPAKVTRSLYDKGQFHSIKMQKPDESYFDSTKPDEEGNTSSDGYHIFKLSYTYDMSTDKASGYDDFTFDVLGYAMAFTHRFTAAVELPKKIDAANVSFRTNKKAEWNPSPSAEEGRRITETEVRILAYPHSENRGYTVQVLLPDGYFTEAPKATMQTAYIPCFILACAAMIAGGVLLLLYRTQKSVAPIEFYPPKGMSVMRYSAVWHGKARWKDIPAMVLKWAAEGYVRIEKDGKRDILITKLKDIPETEPPAEKNYFCALFYHEFTEQGDGNVFSSKQMRKKRAKNEEKKYQLRTAAGKLPLIANVPDPVAESTLRARMAFQVLSVVPLFALLLYYCIFLSTEAPMYFFIFIVSGTMIGYFQLHSFFSRILYVFPVGFVGVSMVAFWISMYYSFCDYFGLIYIALIWWAVSYPLFLLFKKRTAEAQSELGRMQGFRKFLLTAELSRIERVMLDNPFYYSAIIPFCLVMGISKKVEKRFKPLNLVLPEWTNGVPMDTLTHTLSHSITTSGGGGAGSGGGSGGGGGGGSSGGGGGGGGSRGC